MVGFDGADHWAAQEVHRELGSGFLEKVYATALAHELTLAGLAGQREVELDVIYKGVMAGQYFAEIVVQNTVICELKSLRAILPEHEAQLIHYLRATGKHVGLLLNFGAARLQVKRMVSRRNL